MGDTKNILLFAANSPLFRAKKQCAFLLGFLLSGVRVQAMERANPVGVLACMQRCRVTHASDLGQRACFDECLQSHGFYDARTPVAETELQAAWHCCQMTAVACALGAALCKKIDFSGCCDWRQKLSNVLAGTMSESVRFAQSGCVPVPAAVIMGSKKESSSLIQKKECRKRDSTSGRVDPGCRQDFLGQGEAGSQADDVEELL